MKPTMELRFVEREIELPQVQDPSFIGIDSTGKPLPPRKYKTVIRILQQKWLRDGQDPEWQPNEWRDVPVEKEE